MLNHYIKDLLKYCTLVVSTLAFLGCGDGKTCDCCKSKKDCEFGLQCVDLIGGSGKVCGSSGSITTCYNDPCGSSGSKLYTGEPTIAPEEEGDARAVLKAFKDIVEVEDETDIGL